MNERAYYVDDELMHYGVKGMTWKNHKYRTNINGEYVYNDGGVQRFQTRTESRNERFPTRKKHINDTYTEYKKEYAHNTGTKWGPKATPLSKTVPDSKSAMNQVMSETSKVLAENKKQREAYLKSGAQRRQTNSGYGKPSKYGNIYYNLGKDHDKYSTYTVVGKKDSKGNKNNKITFVKDRTKKKRLVTKTTDLGTQSWTGLTGKITGHYKRVEPGRYNSYSDAARGETKRAVKAVKKSAKDAYRVGSNLKTRAAKEVKNATTSASKTYNRASEQVSRTAKNVSKSATKTYSNLRDRAEDAYNDVRSGASNASKSASKTYNSLRKDVSKNAKNASKSVSGAYKDTTSSLEKSYNSTKKEANKAKKKATKTLRGYASKGKNTIDRIIN